MQKKSRIRYELARAARLETKGSTEHNDLIKAIGRNYDMSTGGGPLRGLAMHRQGAKYW